MNSSDQTVRPVAHPTPVTEVTPVVPLGVDAPKAVQPVAPIAAPPAR